MKNIEQRCQEYMENTQNPWRIKSTHTIYINERNFLSNAFGTSNNILDAGGGTGFHLHTALEDSHRKITVLDGNDTLLNEGKTLFPDSRFVKGTCCDMPFSNEEFDGILVRANLLYFSDKASYIKECYRVLKPNGVLVIIDRNRFDITNLVANFLKTKQDPFELYSDFMTFTYLEKLLMKEGFTIQAKKGCMLTIPKIHSFFLNRLSQTTPRIPTRVIYSYAHTNFLKQIARWMYLKATKTT